MTSQRFDLVVIGTGTAASNVAFRCREAGWEVAVVDSRPFGGTCALRGCDPKKVLVAAAEAIDWQQRMEGRGLECTGARIDWAELIRTKHSFIDDLPRRKDEAFAKRGISGLHGRARFIKPNAVQVGDDTLEARHIVIASGARPASLHIPGEEHLTVSDRFLDLERLPERVVFVGGGYISFEFAHVAARAGARVSIVHRGTRPLEAFDPDLVALLLQRTRDLGIDLVLETAVEAIHEKDGELTVVGVSKEGKRRLGAQLVVHGAGRVPDIDDLDLPAGKVERGRIGVKVNEFLQSVSNPAVYAAGDAAESGGPPLTPVAGLEGQIVAENLLQGNHHRPRYDGVPSVVFTVPPLAMVGLAEAAAKEQGLRFRVHHEETSGWYSSRRINETCSGFKVLIDEGNDRILGAHLLGPSAEELVNVFALAIRNRVPASSIKETIFAYPTHGSDIAYML